MNNNTRSPEPRSVAPPARSPPKSWTATQMTAKATIATTRTTCVTVGCRETQTATRTQNNAKSTATAVPS